MSHIKKRFKLVRLSKHNKKHVCPIGGNEFDDWYE